MCCEWVAGSLAKEFGLPIPRFGIVEVPEILISSSARDDIQELGAGPVFASAKVANATEITWEEVQKVPDGLKSRTLFFDWWVHNEDRSLSSVGGNPNLLMAGNSEGVRKLWVFDFNLAFDPDFTEEQFWRAHIFAKMDERQLHGFHYESESELKNAISKLPEIFAKLPLEWLYLDGDESQPVQLDEKMVILKLKRALNPSVEFWLNEADDQQ